MATLKEHIIAASTEASPGAAASQKPSCPGYMGGERGTRSVVDRSGSFTNRRDLSVRSIQHLK